MRGVKTLLAYFSPFFDKALCGGFAEGFKDQVLLPQDEPRLVRLLVDWTVSGQITAVAAEECAGAHGENMEMDLAMAAAWVMGNKYLCPGFCNAIMEHFLEHHRSDHPSPNTLRYVFENTLDDCKLRSAMMDAICNDGPLRDPGHLFFASLQKEWMDYIAGASTEAEQ